MRTIKQNYRIKAPIEKVWQALVEPKIINEWGGGLAKMDDQVGTKFSLWNGDIYGTNKEVSKNKKLVQEWYAGQWDQPSIATFNLSEKDGVTTIDFAHESVPDEKEKELATGWKEYYLGTIKRYLEK